MTLTCTGSEVPCELKGLSVYLVGNDLQRLPTDQHFPHSAFAANRLRRTSTMTPRLLNVRLTVTLSKANKRRNIPMESNKHDAAPIVEHHIPTSTSPPLNRPSVVESSCKYPHFELDHYELTPLESKDNREINGLSGSGNITDSSRRYNHLHLY